MSKNDRTPSVLSDRQLLFAGGGRIQRIAAESELNSPADRARWRVWAAFGAANQLKRRKTVRREGH